MSNVRSYSGVPPVAAFAGTAGTPVVVDIATGNAYVLRTGDVVVQVGGVSGAGGTVTSVNVTSPSGLLASTGGPITVSGNIALAWSGTSGGVPYFSSTTALASSGALTASRIVLGGGAGAAPTVLGSLGTTTTLLHGNAAGAPTFGAVSLTADVSGTLPVGNGGTGVTAPSGTYTPTLTNVANIAASTAYECQYLVVGTSVIVSGKVDIDPTLAATSTQLGISLPVASNFGAAEDCAGVAFAPAIAAQGAAILGDETNNRAQLQYISGDLTNQAMYFLFQYQVI